MLANGSFAVDEAANVVEAMGKIRAAAGRYDAVLLGTTLTSRAIGSLIAEIRGLHLDLPLLLLRNSAGKYKDVADDPCMALIEKPFTAEHLMSALKNLGVRCTRHGNDSNA